MYNKLRGESSSRRVARGLIDADEQVNKVEKELGQVAAEAEQTKRGQYTF